MQTSVFVFAYDLVDEGYGHVLDTIRDRAGATAVNLACSYHHARDVFPHNPRRKVRFLEGGACFFRPDPARYAGLKIQPIRSRLTDDHDPLSRCIEEAERRGMAVRAWTTNLHNTGLGSQYPDCALQNAFGDPYITCLCPANPHARAYLCALSADLASRGVQAILLESIGYHSFDHGYHHERSFVPLSPIIRFLLGLCFCPHCTAQLTARGVDMERVQRFVQGEVERVFNGETSAVEHMPVERSTLAALADGELGNMLEQRCAVVTSLVTEITEAVSAVGSTQVIAMDMSGAAVGYATGMPVGDPAPLRAWEDGLDLPAVASACHGIAVLAYARDVNRVRADLDAYTNLLPDGVNLTVGVRPMPPDCYDAGEMTAKVALLRERGVASMDVYHYGLMRLHHLDWVGQALRAQG
ncbi:MAG: hypothetical protein K6T87_12980 [Roseiflexus sp.]|jgi:hypothetical protein|uniref:hypothetical protein n=1 Tax=Roseiflexus sp. TaxID=2562120 RepID=UPI0025E6B294|nr:hypothetical protein [Roseiflexus sp.]MCL6541472.1 hypothetical protein [Roseiflexus sp.]